MLHKKMEINTNVLFYTLLLLIFSSQLRGQTPPSSPGRVTDTSLLPTASATTYSKSNLTLSLAQNVTAMNNSGTPDGTPSSGGPERNQNDSSITISPSVSTLQQTTLNDSTTANISVSRHNTTRLPVMTSATTVELNLTLGEKGSQTPSTLSVFTQIPNSSVAHTVVEHSSPGGAVPLSTVLPGSQTSKLSTQAEPHRGTLSHLNVGDDEQDPHKLGLSVDPLLVGLVSAFILAAAVISVLLFLKFRRTNSQPAFRRLQDLPMDDMMEDTPLSMYNY